MEILFDYDEKELYEGIPRYFRKVPKKSKSERIRSDISLSKEPETTSQELKPNIVSNVPITESSNPETLIETVPSETASEVVPEPTQGPSLEPEISETVAKSTPETKIQPAESNIDKVTNLLERKSSVLIPINLSNKELDILKSIPKEVLEKNLDVLAKSLNIDTKNIAFILR